MIYIMTFVLLEDHKEIFSTIPESFINLSRFALRNFKNNLKISNRSDAQYILQCISFQRKTLLLLL